MFVIVFLCSPVASARSRTVQFRAALAIRNCALVTGIAEEAVESDRAEGTAARADKNVLAFVDPHREIEVLPECLQTGHVKRRKRGARSDRDCVEEICEIISAGIAAKAACEYVGVPWATWQCWRRNNVENAREKSDLAYEWDLEVIVDATLSIFDD